MNQRMNEMAVTIKDIAKKANVSITTVSRVLNNKSKGVSNETRENIWKIVDELNYVPNAVAKGLVMQKTNLIGLVIPDITNIYYAELSKGIEETADAYGYNILLCGNNITPKHEQKSLRILREQNVAGIVYNSSFNIPEEIVSTLEGASQPFVLVENEGHNDDAMRVYTDSKNGMMKIVEHLIEMGHKRIAYLSGPKDIYSARLRLQGYKEALEKHGLQVDETLIRYGLPNRADGFECTKQLLKSKCQMTAIACFNDLMAVGAMQKLRSKGIQVPLDMSLTGYDNIYLTKITTPQITTVSQPAYEMGCEAAKLLINKIENNNIPNSSTKMDVTLKLRESVRHI